MTALDDAIEEAHQHDYKAQRMGITFTPAAVLRQAVASGLLIPRDDIEGLLKALGAERIGWFHPGCALIMGHDHYMYGRWTACADCPDCRPVYTISDEATSSPVPNPPSVPTPLRDAEWRKTTKEQT